MAPSTPAQEADTALQAVTDQAKSENLARVAELTEVANEVHIAEHIRGMVAVTMAHLSVNASAITRDNAEHWQEWALGVAAGAERGVPAVA